MKKFRHLSDTGKLIKSSSCSTKITEDFGKVQKTHSTNENGLPRSNSVPFHKGTLQNRLTANNGVNNNDMEIQMLPLQNKISDICRTRTNSKESTVRNPQTEHKWNKIRVAMTMSAALKSKKPLERQDSFIKKFTTQRCGNDEDISQEESHKKEMDSTEVVRTKLLHKLIIDPQSGVMCIWLGVVTLTVLYNLWTCIVRQAFTDIITGYEMVWIFLDILADIIYILDIIVQLRTTYLERGLCVFSSSKLAKRYIHSKYFKIDIFSLLPLDLIQFLIGNQPLLRFPRFLKIYRAWKWKIIVENRTIFPNLWRVVNLTHILFLGCHWFAAFYFMISQVEGFQSSWGYPKPVGDFASVTRKYLKSFYWSTLTLTTIGDLPAPEKNWEYIFTIVSYLIGVFVFATIVGQVGNVITNRNANRLEFEKILDNAKNFMRVHNVPNDLQRRVMRWYDYAWARGRTSGCSDISSLALLPDKLKTEMALHVNLETLKKVTIFQECRPEFLHDLVLKMRPFIFTPGDLICRKGEVARELFIISDGVLEVISDSGDVLKKMGSGDFFGEIGILNLDAGVNRRTADVKSVGYSELFVLSKEDVLDALKDHPDAKELIIRYGTTRLNEIKDRRCQKIIQRKLVQSSANTSNFSIEKSLNSCEDTTGVELVKTPEMPSVYVIKSILNRLKASKQSSRKCTICNNNSSSLHTSLSQQKICQNCALANMASDITRDNVTVSPFFERQQKDYSRLNSVPSIVDSNDLHSSAWPNPRSLISRESLIIPNLYSTRKKTMSDKSIDTQSEIAEESLNIDEKNSSIDQLDSISMSNETTLVNDREPPSIGELLYSVERNMPNSISSNQIKSLTNPEREVLTSAIESILCSQTNRLLRHLQDELNHMNTRCQYQTIEIDRLKQEIKTLKLNKN